MIPAVARLLILILPLRACLCMSSPIRSGRDPSRYLPEWLGASWSYTRKVNAFLFFALELPHLPSTVMALLSSREELGGPFPLQPCSRLCVPTIKWSLTVGHDEKKNPTSCDCSKLQTHVPTARRFGGGSPTLFFWSNLFCLFYPFCSFICLHSSLEL